MGAIDLDEIERRIPSPATECAYCHRLGTMGVSRAGRWSARTTATFAAREAISTDCTGAAMVPARHDAATMDRVALVAEVRRLRALLAALVQHENSGGHATHDAQCGTPTTARGCGASGARGVTPSPMRDRSSVCRGGTWSTRRRTTIP